MTKQKVIEEFVGNHNEFIDYINSLSTEQFIYAHPGKWTPGQQVDHVYLCLIPIEKALGSKKFILQKFGKIERPVWEYDKVIEKYKAALEKGGKAPERFVPGAFDVSKKNKVLNDLAEILLRIQNQLNAYTEKEMDELVLPHPLLGKLTIRELFHLMTYHATHHLKQTERNLESFVNTA